MKIVNFIKNRKNLWRLRDIGNTLGIIEDMVKLLKEAQTLSGQDKSREDS